jgi:hypothetical protein
MRNFNFSMNDRDHNDESISFSFDSKNDFDVRHKLRKFFKACEMSTNDDFGDELFEMRSMVAINLEAVCSQGTDPSAEEELYDLQEAFDRVIAYVESEL